MNFYDEKKVKPNSYYKSYINRKCKIINLMYSNDEFVYKHGFISDGKFYLTDERFCSIEFWNNVWHLIDCMDILEELSYGEFLLETAL